MVKLHGVWMENPNGKSELNTNWVINNIIRESYKKNKSRLQKSDIERCINKYGSVHTPDLVDDYVQRIVKHGPFERIAPGVWKIKDDMIPLLIYQSE